MADATLDEFVRRAITAPDRTGRVAVLKELVRVHTGKRSVADVVAALSAEGKKGKRLALEFLARLRPPIPMVAVVAAGSLLANRKLPTILRVAAAGRILSAVPDTPDAVRPVVGWLTVGLSRPRTLSRLFALQCRVRTCATLDGFVKSAEGKLKFRCPRCPARLPKSEFVRHLWTKHRLEFAQGKARDSQKVLDEAVTAGAKRDPDDPAPLDRAFAVAAVHYPDSPPSQTLQALAARSGGAGVDPLVSRAARDHAGLCPTCLAAVPDPVPALPPPLALGGGRLVGDGYSVTVSDSPTGRKVEVVTPKGTEPGTPPTNRLSPRLAAVLFASPIALLGVGLRAVLPTGTASPLLVVGWLTAIACLVYLAVRFLRNPLPDANDVAVDRAWADVVPGIGRKPPAVRFLARLCRTSLRAGSPEARTKAVWDTVEHAAVLADKGWPHQQWLAAARVLQAVDGTKAGRERVSALAGVFEPFLRGLASVGYADAAAETILGADLLLPGEPERLGVLIAGTAFEVGLTAADLTAVARFAPGFRRLLPDGADDHLRKLHTVWRVRTKKPWAETGPATHAFDLAESPGSRKVLADFPDTLLRVTVDDHVDADLGPVLVCTRGLVVGGKAVADAAAAVEVTKSKMSAGYDLAVGPHRFALTRRPPTKFATDLRAWLRFWGTMTKSPGQGDRVNPEKVAGFLAPVVSGCPLCRAQVVVRVGRFGVTWDDVTAGRIFGVTPRTG
jgi:uncharacterized C2H2 Zn-finger protein